MSILDRFRSKEPDFNTNRQSNNIYTWESFTPSTEYLDQFEHWTYRAIMTIVNGVSNVPINLYRDENDDQIEIDPKASPMLRDLYAFNKDMSYEEARSITIANILLTGNAFWYMYESDQRGQKADFVILDPQRMSIEYDKFGLPAYYRFRDGNGQDQELDKESVIVHKLPNPKSPFTGHSPLQSARYAHNIVELGMKYNMNVFGNSGRPEGFLIMDGVTADERDKAESLLKEKFGGVQNARKIGILNQLASWLPISEKPKDIDYVTALNTFRDQILSVFGVPKTLVGIEDSTYANAEQAVRVFQRYTLLPILKLEKQVLNNQLIPKYGNSITTKVYFDFDDPVESDKQIDATVASTLYQSGIITIDEAREQVGLKPNEELYENQVQDDEEQETPEATEQENSEMEKRIEKLALKVQELDEDIQKVPDIEEHRKATREELRKFFENTQDQSELLFRGDLWKYFGEQRERVLKSLIRKKTLSLKGSVDWDKEVATMIDLFNSQYKRQMEKANKLANDLTNVSTDLSESTIKKINKRLEFLSKEVNDTTRNKIEKIIANGVRNGTNPIDVANELNLVLSGFMEGEANIKLLQKLDVYVDALSIKESGTIYRTKNRYELMYEKISKLEGQDKIDALRALYATIDENDKVGLAIRDNITKIYGISVDDTQLSRLWTIARTEVGIIQSEVQFDNFKNSGVVTHLEWLTARDAFVRGLDLKDKYDHVSADGQTVHLGEKFLVSGELLERPLDPSASLGNIINCRCVAVPKLVDNE